MDTPNLDFMVSREPTSDAHRAHLEAARAELAALRAVTASVSYAREYMPLVHRIVRGGLTGDTKLVRSYAEFLAEKIETEHGDKECARLLRMTINGEGGIVTLCDAIPPAPGKEQA